MFLPIACVARRAKAAPYETLVHRRAQIHRAVFRRRAQIHLAALNYLNQKGGLLTVNLGTGQGCSVLEMIKAFEQASGRLIPYRALAIA